MQIADILAVKDRDTLDEIYPVYSFLEKAGYLLEDEVEHTLRSSGIFDCVIRHMRYSLEDLHGMDFTVVYRGKSYSFGVTRSLKRAKRCGRHGTDTFWISPEAPMECFFSALLLWLEDDSQDAQSRQQKN